MADPREAHGPPCLSRAADERGAVSHGVQAETNAGSRSARMYSPLNAVSFLMSKNADDALTSSIRKSRSNSS